MSKRILLVEDDLLNGMMLSAVLENAGLVVRTVTDGSHVLERALEFAPHVITMDINLPNISGLELIMTLRADPKLHLVPILVVTAYIGKGEEALIRQAGASDFLAKPVSIAPFLAAVTGLLPAGATGTQPASGLRRVELARLA